MATTTLVGTMALWLVSAAGAAQPPLQLNQEWLARDRQRIAVMQDALRQPALDVAGLKKRLDSNDIRDDRLIGFGARRVALAVSGGYTTTWVHLLATAPDDHGSSRIAAIRFDQIGSKDTWPAVAPELRPLWQDRVRDVDHGFRIERVDDLLLGELRARTEQALGKVAVVEPPAELAAAFELLTSPLTEVVLGSMYGEDGEPPPGHDAIEALVAAPRFDLVRRVLRGMNPEGRAWAAHALLARAKREPPLDPDDARAIEALRRLELELTCSEGCVIVTRDLTEALAHLDRPR